MSAGGVWTAGSDSNSAARLNQKTVTIDSGANLPPSTTYPGMLIFATDNLNGSFTAGTLYQRNAANSAWTAIIPQSIHDHSAATTAAGGTLLNIFSANMGQFVYQNELISPQATDFNITKSSTASVANDFASNQWRVKLDTAATTSNFAQADIGGLKVDFGNPIKFQAKVEQEPAATTQVQCRIGINIETANLAVSNTTKMLGFEFCNSSGSSYQVVSGDGTTRSLSNTSQAFNGVHSLKLTYTPSTSAIGQIDATTAITKTLNLPNSGACDQDKVMRFGIETLDNVQTKDLYVYAAAIAYVPNDTWTV